MFIKAGSIQNLTDARYFASKGVNMLGFCFDKSSDSYIQPFEAQEIIKWLAGPKLVGEFGNQPVEEIKEIMMVLGLDYVQAPLEVIQENKLENDFKVIPEIDITENLSLEKFSELAASISADFILLNLRKNFNDGKDFTENAKINTEELKSFSQSNPVILDAHFSKENLLSIIDWVQPSGINLVGSKEEKVGSKSFEMLDSFFEILEDEL